MRRRTKTCPAVPESPGAGRTWRPTPVANGTLALLRNPDEQARLRDDPSLDANAIEELLRYDSPVQFSRRIAVEPFEL